MKKKINFKQPKYIIPLIILPFIIFIGYLLSNMLGGNSQQEQVDKKEIAVNLGSVEAPILSKNEAYDNFFESVTDNRSMIQEIDKEQDSLFSYSDNLDLEQKRYIDSLKYERQNKLGQNYKSGQEEYYKPKDRFNQQNYNNDEADPDFEKSKEIIRILNESNNKEPEQEKAETFDPVKSLREQMLFLDSLEKAKDPNFNANFNAQNKLRKNKQLYEAFLKNSLEVSKNIGYGKFNHISRETPTETIKAVIDENIKGYLGSRIRFRILEDIFVGKHKISKGTIIYGQISGFELQRVKLNVVSILNKGQILPINLSVYDMDGMQGLYVPQSTFREMMKELGSNSIQGNPMDSSSEGFLTSFLSRAFTSTSQTIINLIRKNKVKLKYNTYVYLINEKDLKESENDDTQN